MTDRIARLAEHLRYWRDVQQMDIPEAEEIARIAVKFINAELYPKRALPYARCTICSAPLDVPGRPWSRDCGGDCIACMAEAEDPECAEAVAGMVVGEAVLAAARIVLQSVDRSISLRRGHDTPVPDEKLIGLRMAVQAARGSSDG